MSLSFKPNISKEVKFLFNKKFILDNLFPLKFRNLISFINITYFGLVIFPPNFNILKIVDVSKPLIISIIKSFPKFLFIN